jgi:alpha-glucosidase
MRDIHLRRNEILDPPGRKYWPVYKGRDGCRSPMQWSEANNAGFTTATPWLPVHPNYGTRNVASQRADPDSLLNFTKNLLALRKKFPALRVGDFIPLKTSQSVMVFLRQTETQSILVALNFTSHEENLNPPKGNWEKLFSSIKNDQTPSKPLLPYEVRLLINTG